MAFQGIDSRDLYRSGSGMTLRRLGVLINSLPHNSPLVEQVIADQEKAKHDAKVARLEAQQERLGGRSSNG